MNKRILCVFTILAIVAVCTTGCKARQLSSTELGIKVVHLPDSLGGGIRETIPLGKFRVYPAWTSIYPMDTQLQSFTWAGACKGGEPDVDDRINTRAADGNEVHLGVTIQYHLDPAKVMTFINVIGESKYGEEAISHWARSHIRTYLGFLMTEEFYSARRYEQCDVAKAALNRDLNRFGIIVDKVNLDDHTFDPVYQKLIDDSKKAEQDALAKANEVKTTEADWKMQLQTAIGTYNQKVANAEGEKRKTIATADAYYESKQNEAEAIKVAGEKEVEGIKKQIEALKQAGGANIVRLEYGQALLESPARFLVLPGGVNGFNLNTTDYNDLLRTMGLASLGRKPQASREAAAEKK